MQVYGVAASPDRAGHARRPRAALRAQLTPVPAGVPAPRARSDHRPRPAGRHLHPRGGRLAPARAHPLQGRAAGCSPTSAAATAPSSTASSCSEVALEHLHEIRIGDAIFKFVAAGAESYARYRIDGAILGGERPDEDARRRGRGRHRRRLPDRPHRRRARAHRAAPSSASSCSARAARARRSSPTSSTSGAAAAAPSRPSTAPPSRRTCSRASSSATSAAPSPAPTATRSGIVRAADGGTLFLDEIGDMPLGGAGEAPARAPGEGGRPPRRDRARAGRRAHRLRHAPRPAPAPAGGQVPRRSLRAAERVQPASCPRSASARRTSSPSAARSSSATAAPTSPHLPLHDGPAPLRLPVQRARARGVHQARHARSPTAAELDAQHLPRRDQGADEGLRRAQGAAPRTAPRPTLRRARRPRPRRRARRPSPSCRRSRSCARCSTQHHGNVAAVGRELGKERMQVHRWMKRYGIDVEEYR